MWTDGDYANWVAGLDGELHLIGGPYCGYVLYPHEGMASDVHKPVAAQLPLSAPIGSMHPVIDDPEAVSVFGEQGLQMYRRESDRIWRHAGQVCPQPL